MASWHPWIVHARICVTLWLFVFFAASGRARPGTALNSNGTAVENPSNAKLYCEKTKARDVLWFFFTNYVLHALSVRSLPGENFFSSTVFKFCCLLVPYTGVRRGLCLISRASNLAADDLQAAARANALCFVVRRPDWRPLDGDTVVGNALTEKSQEASTPLQRDEKECKVGQEHTDELRLYVKDLYLPPSPSSRFDRFTKWLIETHRFKDHEPNRGGALDLDTVKLQGYCKLAPGYGLSYVPSDVRVFPRQADPQPHSRLYRFNPFDSTRETKIASTHDVPRILFSLVQTVSGGWAIYKARGSQIDRYGFAAFGLTVVPYMVVSIINFLGSLLTSEYETIYMVHSSTMDEMIARGGSADGAIGTLHDDSQAHSSRCSTETTVFSFHEDASKLYCRVERQDTYRLVLPHDEPLPRPKISWKQRLRHGQLLLRSSDSISRPPRSLSWKQHLVRGHFWLRPPKPFTPIQEFKNPCIIVPSQSSFTRLPTRKSQPSLDALVLFLLATALSAPWILMALLSGFRANRSTSTQRNFVLAWLIAGQIQGYAVGHVERHMNKKTAMKGLLTVFLSYGANCLCGLVIVGQEMVEFGTCKAVD